MPENEAMTKIAIYVAAHKPAPLPDNFIYHGLQVGAQGQTPIAGFQPDNTGVEISAKNPHYNELTGLYWLWQNSDADVLGLVHYRRLFIPSKRKDLNDVLNASQINELLANHDVIVPNKRHYYIETNEQQYRHAHHGEALDVLREVIATDFAEFAPAFETVMKRRSVHLFNMFVMKRALLADYATFVFAVLAKVEARLQDDIGDWSLYEQRVYGFLSERLLDTWLETRGLTHAEVPVVFMEKQNWLRKGGAFLARKFGFGKIR